MKELTIRLPEDVYKHIELRAAIDDLRPEEGIEALLTHVATVHMEKRPVITHHQRTPRIIRC